MKNQCKDCEYYIFLRTNANLYPKNSKEYKLLNIERAIKYCGSCGNRLLVNDDETCFGCGQEHDQTLACPPFRRPYNKEEKIKHKIKK